MVDDLASQWNLVHDIVDRARRSTGHLDISSVDVDGNPTITPIGTVFLRTDCTGFYFDEYTEQLAKNLDDNPHFCLMAVDGGSIFWLRSLLTGRFRKEIGARLYGTAGPRRPATGDELDKVHQRVRLMRLTRGGRALWSDFSHVRDLQFTGVRLVRYPVMMPDSPH